MLEGDVNIKYYEGNVVIILDGKCIYFDCNDYFNGKYDKDDEGIN